MMEEAMLWHMACVGGLKSLGTLGSFWLLHDPGNTTRWGHCEPVEPQQVP